jgi:hypothetical protein
MNKLPLAKRIQILTLLCDGTSMCSIERIIGCSINAVDKPRRVGFRRVGHCIYNH